MVISIGKTFKSFDEKKEKTTNCSCSLFLVNTLWPEGPRSGWETGTYISFQVFLRGEAGIFSGDTQIAGGDSSRLNID
jgi:hypothetical protein